MKRSILVVLMLSASLFAQADEIVGDADAGKAQFTRLCGGCHKVGPDARSSFGPQLNGLIGRKAGSSEDYQYSDAMRNAGFVWTPEQFSAYIEDPSDVVPGTRMIFWGLSNKQKIADLLAYLRANP